MRPPMPRHSGTVYLVEAIRHNRRVDTVGRKRYYENADDLYVRTKADPSQKFIELRLLRKEGSKRILLKFIMRGRRAKDYIPGVYDDG